MIEDTIKELTAAIIGLTAALNKQEQAPKQEQSEQDDKPNQDKAADKAKNAAAAAAKKAAEAEAEKKADQEAKDKADAPDPSDENEDEPEPKKKALPKAPDSISLVDLRGLGKMLLKADKQEELSKICARFDAKSLTTLDESHYAKVWTAMQLSIGEE